MKNLKEHKVSNIKYICPECGYVRYKTLNDKFVDALLIAFSIILLAIVVMGIAYCFYSSYLFGSHSYSVSEQMEAISDRYSEVDYIVSMSKNITYDCHKYEWNGTEFEYCDTSTMNKLELLHDYVKDKAKLEATPDIFDEVKDPSTVLLHGGDCEDYALLYMSLAKAQGIECHPLVLPNHMAAWCLVGENVVISDINSDFGLMDYYASNFSSPYFHGYVS